MGRKILKLDNEFLETVSFRFPGRIPNNDEHFTWSRIIAILKCREDAVMVADLLDRNGYTTRIANAGSKYGVYVKELIPHRDAYLQTEQLRIGAGSEFDYY